MTVDKRTVALGVAAAAAVAAAVTVTVTNHKAGPSGPRKRVGDYITSVNAIQNAMQTPLSRVLLAYRHFSEKGPIAHDPRPELATASATLARLDRRLAALPAPPEAATLRLLILRLVGQELKITREVHGIAVFAPAFGALLAEAHRANASLGTALGKVTIPKAQRLKGTKAQVLAAERRFSAQSRVAAAQQADAVDAYDSALATVVGRLAKLDPPQVFRPGYAAQVHAMKAVIAAGDKLAAELGKLNRTDVSTLGRRFTVASRSAQSVAAQRSQIAAIRAYNVRARGVAEAAVRVQAELRRLQRHLP